MKIELTYNQRLENAGIKTIYPDKYEFSRKEKRSNEIFLEFNGKKVPRPLSPEKIKEFVLREFNLEI